MSNRSYDEDVDYWIGRVNGVEPEEQISPLLPHLTDIEVLGLGDSYDDGRIDTLAIAFINLRKMYRKLEQADVPD